MKTIEEIEKLANKLYPEVSFKKDVESEDTFRMNEIRRIERLAFAEGYKQGYDYGYEIGKNAGHGDGYKKGLLY